MAAEVRPLLANIDRAAYARFLDAMVHYTRVSGDRLRHAAERSPTPELRAFFAQLAHEESGHYRLAEADLAALGGRPSDVAPPGVDEFHRSWMESDHPATWLGSLHALENVARHLAADVPAHLARLGLDRSQVRFVMTHLRADEGHGDLTRQHASAIPDEALLGPARYAAAFWVKLHRDAFCGAQPGGS